ncbi:DUF4366 domain-containing protein [bacterium 1xD42-87]|nr:DUF4366 domain-containing protein [bacterium 1xD42-87]
MKNKLYTAGLGLMLLSLAFPSYAQASDGEEYITISVDAVDDSTNLQYALDSDDPSAFTESNEFTVPAGTSHTIYVKDTAGNITSQQYEPDVSEEDGKEDFYDDGEEQQINIDLELGRKTAEEEELSDETGNPGTASVSSRTKTDGTVDGEKVFYTFSTKEGEELYLVVDQGRGTDNVYLLDTVSLGDLRVLADNSDTSSAPEDKNEDNLLAILAEEDEAAEEQEGLQEKEKPKSTFGNGLVILLFAGIGGGIYYYIKIYKNKKDEAMDVIDAMDMDEFVPEEEEEEELDFDYDDAEKEKFLEALINGDTEEDEFLDQDPDEYATPHTEEELDENFGDADFPDDEEPYDGMEIGF